MGSSVGVTTDLSVDGDLYVTGNITAFFPSDKNLKDRIQQIAKPDQKMKSLSGNMFVWNEKAGKTKQGQIDYGVIAQEVEKEFPELVVEDKNGVKKVRYEGLTPVMIEAIKDLIGRVEAIEMGSPNAPRNPTQMQMPQYPYPYPPYPYPYPPQQPPQEPQQ